MSWQYPKGTLIWHLRRFALACEQLKRSLWNAPPLSWHWVRRSLMWLGRHA